MADMSPAAQDVWSAAWQLSPVNCESHEDRRRQQIAAAFHALAAHGEAVEIRTAPGIARATMIAVE